MPSFYEILEVSPAASAAEIRAAYLELARQYHPDRVPEHLTKLRRDAEEKLKHVNEAWSVLGDPARRRKYDLTRGNGGGRGEPRRAASPPPAPPAPQDQPARVAPGIFERWRIRTDKDKDKNKDAVKWALMVATVTLLLVVGVELIAFRNSGAQSSSPESSAGDQDQEKDSSPVRNGPPPTVVPSSAPPIRLPNSQVAAGAMDLQLLAAAISDDQIQLTFRIHADGRGGSLLYEPPGGSVRRRNILGKQVAVDRGLEEMYLVDNNGVKYYSTTGLVGGKQTNFDLYNYTRRVDLAAHAEATLSASFPPAAGKNSTVTLVSPALGRWQPEWTWPAIRLK